jgi:hypothetical protein
MSKKSLFYIFEKVSEFWGGVVIAISILGVGVIFGVILFSILKGLLGTIVFWIITIASLFYGIYISIKNYKGKGTIHLLSRTMASPDLDAKIDIKSKDNTEK